MTEITQFFAIAFDFMDGHLAAAEPIVCASPAIAIKTAQRQWKFLGHAGTIAFSSTSDFEKRQYNHKHVLSWFGQVPNEYLSENEGE